MNDIMDVLREVQWKAMREAEKLAEKEWGSKNYARELERAFFCSDVYYDEGNYELAERIVNCIVHYCGECEGGDVLAHLIEIAEKRFHALIQADKDE